MSFTYSGNPANSATDEVRFLVGDTNSSEPLTTDEEIEYALSRSGNNVYAAASIIADAIATIFATLADTEEIGPIKAQYANRLKFYTQTAKALAAKVPQLSQINVYGGGIDIQDKIEHEADTSLVVPNFSIGMNDFAPSAIGVKDI